MLNLLLTSKNSSPWVSCQVISPNLKSTYEKIFSPSELSVKNYGQQKNIFETYDLAQSIFKLKPKNLIFIDHAPHPLPLLKELDRLYEKENRPQLYFHIFGDFTLDSPLWLKMESLLKKFKVTFIAASQKELELIQSFSSKDFQRSIHYLPFPTNEDDFYFDDELEKKARDFFKISQQEHIFTYTGRLSEQKNIIPLIQCFSQVLKMTSGHARLYLAGDSDNIGIPYIGLRRPEGYFAQLLFKELKKIPPEYNKKIIFLGHLEKKELLTLLHATDTYVSLSTHNDEDFGMSPIEALMCGRQSILTNWGGYSSFKNDLGDVDFIDVHFKDNYPQVSYKDFIAHCFKNTTQKRSFEQKKKCAQYYKDHFSIFALTTRLKEIYERPSENFNEFTEIFKEMAQAFSKSKNAPFLNQIVSYSDTYGKIYAPYFRKD